MYRWLLCWQYLRTRYIALASVVSVTLGVATLIIVNSVMHGFTTEMQERMHGILSDVVVESHHAEGLINHEQIQARIRELVGDDLEGMTTVVHVPAMVSINHMGEPINRQINLIGIDTESYANVSDFSKYLIHPENKNQISFDLKENGYVSERPGFPMVTGWEYRRRIQARIKLERQYEQERQRNQFLNEQIERVLTERQAGQDTTADALQTAVAGTAAQGTVDAIENNENASSEPTDEGFGFPEPPPSMTAAAPPAPATITTAAQDSAASSLGSAEYLGPRLDGVETRLEDAAKIFDPEVSQHVGVVLGISIGSTRYRDLEGEVNDYFYVQPGDDVQITFPSAGATPRAINERFTVVDFYESKMSEYDSTFAFVPLESLQKFRGMQNAISSIQLRLKSGADLDQVRDLLRAQFPLEMSVQVSTWRDLQGALLAAVQMETTILNILLFLIIAVAGFGILATFFMIVVEKTKDIGILKSLGATGSGVASIFLGYGVLLGLVGAGVGAVAGLIFVANINAIADVLESITGQEVFDPMVYYFDTIPTIVHPMMVVWVVIGAVLIAVMASVLPSIRAARMHPVRALRYE